MASETNALSPDHAAQPRSTPATSPGARFLPILLVLFAASGCAALIYEIVWFQLLQLALGQTAVSLAVLLTAFMGGLCAGSLGLPRLNLAGQHPLRVYAWLEAGIAFFALIVGPLISFFNRINFTGEQHGVAGLLLRGVIALVCLLPPTVLMGASLPALARWIQATPQGLSWWGWLYGGNTAGAVIGCLVAGFYFLRVYNMAITTYVAAAMNVAVALGALLLAKWTPASANPDPAAPEPVAEPEPAGPHAWTIYAAIALSGATALGAEVVWTRLMGMLLLATVYVLSAILAVFLSGLAIGSAAGAWLIPRVRPRLALGWCQIPLVAAIAWTAFAIVHSLPYWTDDKLTTVDPWRMFLLDLKRCVWALLPATILWGASFPLACAAAARPKQDSARLAGGIYAANTLGSIVGAVVVSLILIPWIGSAHSERVLIAISALSGALVLVPLIRQTKSIALGTGLAVSLAAAALLWASVDPIPGELIAYGRRMGVNVGASTILYSAEGRNSSVAISQWNTGAIYVNVNGHVEATTEPYDMRLQRMVGHLPALLHPNPQSVLGIGFGAGVSAGTFTRYPTIRKITICEIEPVIPPASTRFFGVQDYQVALNPRTHIVFDDARHFLLTTADKFDIIASDPLDVFIKGTAALYSKEYFEAVKQHLNPGGMFTLYVPLYESDEPTVRSELATFFAVFPHATVWANLRDGLGYDTVFMGQADPLKIDVDAIQQRLDRPDYAPVAQSLSEIEAGSAVQLFATFLGQQSDLGPWIKGAEISHDNDLKLQYLAGWGINSAMEDVLYRKMLALRRPPHNLFTGSLESVRALMSQLVGADR
ncbi:MAG TPA: fused MFS/spermidine synthase [Bryobacteraceae bacterium]|nr:fused MFS/spermidine synthase [Bryobacteraceae bacterium]